MTIHLLVPDPLPLIRDMALRFPTHTVLGGEAGVEEGLEAAARLRPDVVLYCFSAAGDIPWEAAMRSLRSVGAEVVVLSEWPTFAYEAFRFEAAGFALWPPDLDELQEVLERVERRVQEKNILRGDL